MKKFSRYKMNLEYDSKYIYSYKTKVAEIDGDKLIKLPWDVGGRKTSPTTNKHINYAASELNLKLEL